MGFVRSKKVPKGTESSHNNVDISLGTLPIERYYEKLISRIISFVSYTPRTEKDIRGKIKQVLDKWKVSPELHLGLTYKVINYLKELKLLDDRKYLEDFIKSKLSSTIRKSPNQIKVFLLKRGFTSDSVDKVLRSLSREYLPEYLEKNLKKLTLNLSGKLDYKSKSKLLKKLTSKGIPLEVALRSVDTFFKVK